MAESNDWDRVRMISFVAAGVMAAVGSAYTGFVHFADEKEAEQHTATRTDNEVLLRLAQLEAKNTTQDMMISTNIQAIKALSDLIDRLSAERERRFIVLESRVDEVQRQAGRNSR